MSTKYILTLLFTLLVPLSVNAQSQEYLWPTDASPYLTSTFGETRSAHFHAGLDIKTWGREGYKVFASKDGYVSRLGIAVDGYGKVIYLQHEDGSSTVYAHLQRFNNELQSYIDSLRLKDFSFEIDVQTENEEFYVKQGEVIGYTGSTGVGPPHLHFEIRDQDGIPINALSTNLAVEDSIAPTLSALIAVPLSEETIIRGSRYPQTYYPTRQENGDIDFGTIEASGPVGLMISTFDEADGVTNKYAVYRLKLSDGIDTLFYQQIDRFSFDETDLMFNDRFPAFGASRRSYQVLFEKEGPSNPFYKIVDPRSAINLIDSVASFTISAVDFYGNTTKASVTINGSSNNSSMRIEPRNEPIQNWYWSNDWAFTGSEVISLTNQTICTPWNPELNQHLVNYNGIPLLWTRVFPDQNITFSDPTGDLTLKFLEDTFFDTLTVSAYTGKLDGYHYLNIQPEMIPSRSEIKIEYYLRDDFDSESRYQLFRIDRARDEIRYVDSKQIGRTIHGYPSALGEFLIMPDNEPPKMDFPKIIDTSYGKWLLHISAEDPVSGIDFESTTIFVNGVQGIVEYDNEEDLLIYYNPSFIPKKENLVTVNISDRAGNTVTENFRVLLDVGNTTDFN